MNFFSRSLGRCRVLAAILHINIFKRWWSYTVNDSFGSVFVFFGGFFLAISHSAKYHRIVLLLGVVTRAIKGRAAILKGLFRFLLNNNNIWNGILLPQHTLAQVVCKLQHRMVLGHFLSSRLSLVFSHNVLSMYTSTSTFVQIVNQNINISVKALSVGVLAGKCVCVCVAWIYLLWIQQQRRRWFGGLFVWLFHISNEMFRGSYFMRAARQQQPPMMIRQRRRCLFVRTIFHSFKLKIFIYDYHQQTISSTSSASFATDTAA